MKLTVDWYRLAVCIAASLHPNTASSQAGKAIDNPLIVFIHGRGNAEADSAILRQQWYAAFQKGAAATGFDVTAISPSDMRFVYYGDLYRERPVSPSSEDRLCAATILVSRPGGSAMHEEPNEEYLIGQRHWAETQDAKGPIGDRIKAWLAGAAFQTPVGQYLAQTWFKDVRRYVEGSYDLQCATNARLSAQLFDASKGSRPVILVAHSMGSLIAYSVLAAMDHDPIPGRNAQVRRLVTIGSPLGMIDFIPFLTSKQPSPYAVPRSLQGWRNVAGYDDPIAQQGLTGSFSWDERNHSEIFVQTRPGDPHSAEGYLENPWTARTILKGWCGAHSAPPATCLGLADLPDGSKQ
jgi:pimeloyl-ACP methyl ester carboxylesterase